MSLWQQVKEVFTPGLEDERRPGDDQERQARFQWIHGRRYVTGSVMTSPKDAGSDQFLDFQHYIVRHVLGGNHHAPLTEPRRMLDVGCGTGRWAAEMAAEFPGAAVVGLDIVPPTNVEPMLAPLGSLAANVSFVAADARAELPFADGAFDYVHMALLYSDLPAVHWPGLTRELARVVRPGGWVECVEPGEAIYDPSPAYARSASWINELCRQRGLDPDLGPKLRQLLWSAGLEPVTEHILPAFPDTRRTRERRLWEAQAVGVFEAVFRDPILDAGITTQAEYESAMQAMREEFEAGQHANSDLIYVVYGQSR
jgi:SAM-dependent methyltransferase